jgi:hypothetical protein
VCSQFSVVVGKFFRCILFEFTELKSSNVFGFVSGEMFWSIFRIYIFTAVSLLFACFTNGLIAKFRCIVTMETETPLQGSNPCRKCSTECSILKHVIIH